MAQSVVVVQGAPAMGRWSHAKHDGFRDALAAPFNTMALKCSHGASAEPLIARLIEQSPNVIDLVPAKLPERFPARVAGRIFKGLRHSVTKLARMASS